MKKQIMIKCSKCGYVPRPDKKLSNKNWNVFDAKCPKCKEKMELCLEE